MAGYLFYEKLVGDASLFTSVQRLWWKEKLRHNVLRQQCGWSFITPTNNRCPIEAGSYSFKFR
jgi:hypothetical protein